MISLSLVTAMVAQFAGTTNQAGNAMGVFFTFCFITFYGGGIDVVSYVYCSTLPPRFDYAVWLTEFKVKSIRLSSGLRAWHGPSSALSCRR